MGGWDHLYETRDKHTDVYAVEVNQYMWAQNATKQNDAKRTSRRFFPFLSLQKCEVRKASVASW